MKAETKTSTVLIVDDEPATRQALEELLAGEGYTLALARNGTEALGKAAELTPDLILLDVKMPDIDGFEVCRRLRADPSLADIPIIMATSLADRDSRLRGFEVGADGFISKPVDDIELLAWVRTTTRLNRCRRLLFEQTCRQQKEAIERLRHQNELILNAAGEGIFGLDRQGRHTFVNPAAAHMLGYTVEELLDQPSHTIWHHTKPDGTTHPENECPIYAAYQDGTVHRGNDELFWRKNGSSFPVEYISTPIYEGSEVVGAVVVFRDITEQKRAEEVLRRQLEESIVLQMIATAAAEATDEDALIEHAVQVIGKILYPDSFGVLLLDEAENILHVHSSYQAHPRMKSTMPTAIPLSCGITGQVASEGLPRRISDVRCEPGYQAANPLTRSELCVPLKAGKHILGVINVESVRVDAFSEADERLLITFSGQLATAIEKVRLMETLEQRVADRTEELAALYDVTAATSQSWDLDITLERVLERTLETMGGKAGAIQLLDKAGENLRLAAHKGIPPRVVTSIDSLPIEDSAWASWIIEHGQSLVILDLSADPRTTQTVHANLPFSYAGVPMQAGGQILGILSVFGKERKQFSLEEVAMLASIAGHVGVAVESARLRQRAEQAAVLEERERLARELHDSVTQLLYSLTLLTEGSRRLARSGRLESVDDCLADLGQIAQQALKEMRLLIYELRPSALEKTGLIGALQQRLEAVEGRTGVKAHLHTEGEIALPKFVEEGLYRIAGEALNNSLKHAAATDVMVDIRAHDHRIELEVEDNGVGFDPDGMMDKGGIGLTSMHERARELGGALTVASALNEGTKVQVAVSF